jgi:hypothetical protein
VTQADSRGQDRIASLGDGRRGGGGGNSHCEPLCSGDPLTCWVSPRERAMGRVKVRASGWSGCESVGLWSGGRWGLAWESGLGRGWASGSRAPGWAAWVCWRSGKGVGAVWSQP